MQRDSERRKLFNRRVAMLAGGKLALVSALAGRMYYLQVLESERYRTLADENRISLRLLPPPRGRIVDRFGTPMAVNQRNYRVVLVPEQAKDVEGTLDTLGSIIALGENERRRVLREVRRRRAFVPVTIRENLNWEEVARIEVNSPDLPGVSIDVGQSRHYPFATDTAPVLGYVAAVSEKELTGDPLLELPGFRIGKAGMERIHDLALRGQGGSSQVEVNAFGRVIRELSRREGQPGAEVWLTVDLELQRFVAARLGEESASAVVLDIHNGDVLALASTPSYEPNAFNKGLSGDEWRKLVSNPRAPLTNKAIAGLYAPGSTFKMVVALAALERGVIQPNNRIFCPGHVELGDAKFHCWKKHGHGAMDMLDAISQSCDVYFYEVARRTGIERIGAMARRFGMGQTLGLDLPGEQAGLIPSRKWKQAAIGTPWQMGETMIAGIGQGYILTTPMQLAVMMARLANGGVAVMPRLTRAVRVAGGASLPLGAEVGQFRSLDINPQHLELVMAGTDSVVNHPRGTAFRARIQNAQMAMGGKTGTVQVRRITKTERDQGVKKSHELPWKDRDHALFVGYAPVHAPRYAVAVVVEHGGGGASTAAPVGRDILTAVQERFGGGPDGVKSISGLAPASRAVASVE